MSPGRGIPATVLFIPWVDTRGYHSFIPPGLNTSGDTRRMFFNIIVKETSPDSNGFKSEV
jgi:hypothetical protein